MSIVMSFNPNLPERNQKISDLVTAVVDAETRHEGERQDAVNTNRAKYKAVVDSLENTFDLFDDMYYPDILDIESPLSFQLVGFIADLKLQVADKVLEEKLADEEFIVPWMLCQTANIFWRQYATEWQARYFLTKIQRSLH